MTEQPFSAQLVTVSEAAQIANYNEVYFRNLMSPSFSRYDSSLRDLVYYRGNPLGDNPGIMLMHPDEVRQWAREHRGIVE